MNFSSKSEQKNFHGFEVRSVYRIGGFQTPKDLYLMIKFSGSSEGLMAKS
jgi:hypothetical protein